MNYIPLESIVSDWIDLTGHDGFFSKDLLLKFAQDEIQKLVRGEQAKQYISLLNVEDYKTELPANFKSIAQIAYNIFPDKPVLKTEITEFTQKVFDGSGCELKIKMDCPKCYEAPCRCNYGYIEIDADRIYKTNNPQQHVAYQKHFYGYTNMTQYPGDKMSYYHGQFRLMGPSSNNFGNLQYHISDCINLNLDTDISYTLDVPYLVTNMKRGQILLSYMGHRLDDNGGMLIPNIPEAIESIVLYMELRMAFIERRKSRSSEDRMYYLDLKQEYDIAHKKAKAVLELPPADEMSMIWRNSMRKLLPYYDRTENLDRKQHDQFRYPGQTSGLIY